MFPTAYLVCLWLLSLSWNRATSAYPLSSQTFQRRALDQNKLPPPLHLFFADDAAAAAAAEPQKNGFSAQDKVPFVIERIGDNPGHVVFQETAEMCIDVFFNDDPNPNAPWKQVQLSYLRNLQQSDLHDRKTSRKWKNEMFVARRVIPVSEIGTKASALKKPIVLDLDSIINLPYDVDNDEDYVKDQVIGFVEVTEKTFGLPESNGEELRPVLTNLAVHPSFRKAGVGSQLLKACEVIVSKQWNSHNEIVLEVEDDNPKALAFYSKRGYQVMFEDPASRRYDVTGFFLQKKQCTKVCMRKILGEERGGSFNLLQSLRQSVFSK